MPAEPDPKMCDTLKKAAAAMRDAEVDFALAGGFASWARGGPASDHDLDFVVRPDHAERALDALVDAGLRSERPPEGWLYKAFDGDVMVDLIFDPTGMTIDDEVLARADELEVNATSMRVMAADDVLATKLLALTEHHLGYEGCLEVARALREQIDWPAVEKRCADSPFAKAFFVLAHELGIADDDVGTSGS